VATTFDEVGRAVLQSVSIPAEVPYYDPGVIHYKRFAGDPLMNTPCITYIRCLHCGHSINIGANYDSYSGPLCCMVCKHVMNVRIDDGQFLASELAHKYVVAARPHAQVAYPQ
jgi:hypothetical protein